MSSATTDDFVAALESVSVTTWTTTAAAVTDALDAASVDPAVGTDLPYEGIALTETSVTVDPTPAELRAARTGVTPATAGITQYGSVVLRCSGDGAEFVSLYPERHVVVVAASQIVPDMPDAIDAVADEMRDESADLIVATGPSATADMGAVVQGVHGPRAVHVIVVEDR